MSCTRRFDWSMYIVSIDDRRALVNEKRCDEFCEKGKRRRLADLQTTCGIQKSKATTLLVSTSMWFLFGSRI